MPIVIADHIKDIVSSITGIRDFNIIPVGNHELNRHLVYLIKPVSSEPLIIKFYYKKNRRNREIAALKLLAVSTVKCPKIIKYGELEDSTEWLLSDHIEGHTFERVKNSIPYHEQLKIMEEMGHELGKIHSYKAFDFFGNWDEYGNSIDYIRDCTVNSIISMEYAVREVKQQDLPDRGLLDKAVIKIRNNYHILDDIKESRLRHNDFDGRNILVKQKGGEWALTAVIDFEQSMPGNIDMDIAGLYHKYFLDNTDYEKAFFRGYNEYRKVSPGFYDRLGFYLLCIGVTICSWTYGPAPDYYKEGLRLVRMFV